MALVEYEQVAQPQPMATESSDSRDDSPPPFVIRGHRTPTGYGKVLYKRADPAMATESAASALPVRRRLASPPPIRGPPGQMEFSDDDESEQDVLRRTLKGVVKRLESVEDRLGEEHMRRETLEDDVEWLRKGFGAKLKRIADASGTLDAFYGRRH